MKLVRENINFERGKDDFRAKAFGNFGNFSNKSFEYVSTGIATIQYIDLTKS